MSGEQNVKDESAAALSLKTGISLAASAVASWTMNEWIQAATLMYLTLQIAWLIRKHIRGPGTVPVEQEQLDDGD